MSLYQKVESTFEVKPKTYLLLEDIVNILGNIEDSFSLLGFPLAYIKFDTLVLTKAQQCGEFGVTKEGEKLVYLSSLGKCRRDLTFVVPHEIGHVFHYTLEQRYGSETVNEFVTEKVSWFETTSRMKNSVGSWYYTEKNLAYDSKPDEIFARMFESLMTTMWGIPNQLDSRILYTLDEAQVFFRDLHQYMVRIPRIK